MAVTALAGPVSNFLLAIAMIFAASLMMDEAAGTAVSAGFLWFLEFFLSTSVLSIGLGLFNLVPIPPLDGSKILAAVLPEKIYYILMRYERYGMLLLFVVIWLDIGSSYLTTAIQAVYYWMIGLFF